MSGQWNQGYHQNIDLLGEDSSFAFELELMSTSAVRILDVGCSCGDLGRILGRRGGYSVTGLEIDEEAVALAKATGVYAKVLLVDLEQFSCENYPDLVKAFDCIVFSDVLEHLRNPSAVLLEVTKCLVPEGRLIASIPNVAHMSVKANLLANDFTYTKVGLLDSGHVRFFTRDSIARLMANAHFAISDVRFTWQSRNGMQPNDPYDRLPVPVKEWIYADWESHVCQYVFSADRAEGPDAESLYNHNLARLAPSIESVPSRSRDNRIKLLSDLGPSRHMAVYFDVGQGFSEEHVVRWVNESVTIGLVERDISLPDNCRAIRIDPSDGPGLKLLRCDVRAENKECNRESHNGKELGDGLAFLRGDPWISFSVPPGIGCVHISMVISFMEMDNMPALMAMYDALRADRDAIAADRDALRADRDAIAADRDALRADHDAIAADRDALRADRDAIAADRDRVVVERNQLENSASWRLTRPLRGIMRRFRRFAGQREG